MYIDTYNLPISLLAERAESDARLIATQAWIQAMNAEPALMSNWYAEIKGVSFADQILPVALGHPHPKQTYLASAVHGYIDYARDELALIQDDNTRKWARRALALAEPWMNGLSLDRAVSVNAWGVSTHLYPRWTEDQVRSLTLQLATTYPDRPLWVRTLNTHQNGELMRQLARSGWVLLPSRQVYLFDSTHNADWITKRNNQIDQKLLRKTPLTLCQHADFTEADAQQMAVLYDMLYVQKHSIWNAIYTPAYFRMAITHRWLEFVGFRNEAGQLVAFIGIYADDSAMTTPMLGYDTQLPQTLGLYRLLMAAVLRLSLERQTLLNLGAGSAGFKKMRGGQAEMEWQAFYVRQLSWAQRIKMGLTHLAMKKTVPSFLTKQAV